MAYAEDFARLQRFFTRSPEMVSVDGVQFYINPTNWTETTETVHVDVVTAGGIGRFDFGLHPTTYTFYGTTGIGGTDELLRMSQFELRMRRGPARAVPVTYPNVWTGVRNMYIDSFKKEQGPEGGNLYIWVSFQATEYPGGIQTYTQLPDSANVGVYLPPGG